MPERPGFLSFAKLLLATIMALVTLPFSLVKQVFHRNIRWLTLPCAIALGALVAFPYLYTPPAPPDSLAIEELRRIHETLLRHVERGGPNHLHSRRLFYYAERFARDAGASVDAVRAAALLHDATKEKGRTDPMERFCHHGDDGASLASETLRSLGKSQAFADHVSNAVREHMGPTGFSPGALRRRFMSRFCSGYRFPGPWSREAKVLYDVDMLDLMTVDGMLKVVTNRQKNPEFDEETIEQSARSGRDSAWRSVVEADQTLKTKSARQCGADLREHSDEFLDSVDWTRTKDLDAFATAVREFKQRTPLPECLPRVPT